MKKIYIVLTYTGTLLSNIIRLITKDEYCHCSISLDKELTQMYSFGRLNPYNPFIGGFVQEGINHGTFKRFKKTTTAIYEMRITNKNYIKLEQAIEDYKMNKAKYSYNTIGLMTATFGLKLKRKHHFYCSEFVQDVLKKADIQTNLPKIPKPEDFKKLKRTQLIYTGILRQYNGT